MLVHNGKYVEECVKRAELSEEDVLHAIRQREQSDIATVRFTVLEPEGEINVVASQIRTP